MSNILGISDYYTSINYASNWELQEGELLIIFTGPVLNNSNSPSIWLYTTYIKLGDYVSINLNDE